MVAPDRTTPGSGATAAVTGALDLLNRRQWSSGDDGRLCPAVTGGSRPARVLSPRCHRLLRGCDNRRRKAVPTNGRAENRRDLGSHQRGGAQEAPPKELGPLRRCARHSLTCRSSRPESDLDGSGPRSGSFATGSNTAAKKGGLGQPDEAPRARCQAKRLGGQVPPRPRRWLCEPDRDTNRSG